jgi:hypothetical protein
MTMKTYEWIAQKVVAINNCRGGLGLTTGSSDTRNRSKRLCAPALRRDRGLTTERASILSAAMLGASSSRQHFITWTSTAHTMGGPSIL